MKDIKQVQEFYDIQKQNTQNKVFSLKNKLKLNTWLRAISFIVGALLTFFAFNNFTQGAGIITILISVFVLLILVRKSVKLNNSLNFLNIKINLIENEQKAINYDFSALYSGNEFINPEHNFSYDLDVFGKDSVFQMINRAKTINGINKTASYLQKPITNKEKIEDIQKAVQQIKQNAAQNIDFIANAQIARTEEDKKEANTIEELSEISKNKFNKPFWKLTLIIQPIITLILLILTVLGIIHYTWYTIYVFLMLGVVGTEIKYINNVHSKTSKLAKTLKRYSALLTTIENINNESNYINNLKNNLKTENKTASVLLSEFSVLLNALDNRLNFIFAFLSNSHVLWDAQIVKKIENWFEKNGDKLKNWIDVIAEYEFLISLSTFSINNPDYVFPKISQTEYLSAQKIGHPIINRNKLVTNNFKIDKNAKTFIVTGANMAGKSTFIRTIGVNYILAQIGSVVCAKEMIFKPQNIITSIRITDNLASDQSYFYAELKRLKSIVDRLEENTDFLIIIDEMLRGTNSIDKHKGSEGIIRKLSQKNVVSFLATHDVQLGVLEDEFPEKIKNYCFEAEIINDDLIFDYKLRSGTSKNLNASYLMKKMKII
ncbi:MAG: hypothetical protein JXR68_03260 [Bacteroidales bacterium]|nr:hypothetical protein [Bacteroidales bacterium]